MHVETSAHILKEYIPEALLALLLLCFVIQLLFLLVQQRRLAIYRLPSVEQDMYNTPPVSVIISARNEAENLKKYLPAVLNQDYPDFEVIVIDDCSSDDSRHIIEEFCKVYNNLKMVTVTERPRFKTGKKFALTMGIKASKNECLIFTDADCKPASENWIAHVAANFSTTKDIILGYSPYLKSSGFINAFVRFETLKTGINYLSAALGGDAYMGIGRNLAYKKSLFFKSKGFASHLHVLAGDDDLFVNRNATAENTVIEIHPDAFTFSESKNTLRGWFRQKQRHMGVGGLYKNKHRRMLSLEAMSGFVFYIAIAACLFYWFMPLVALCVYLLRLLTQYFVYYKSAKKLTGLNLLWLLPVFDLLYYTYLNVFGLIGTFIKTTRWK